jgi:hypothetical protein
MVMKKGKIKPFNVIDNSKLPEMDIDGILIAGDPIEIDSEIYFVCDTNHELQEGIQEIGVVPLVVRNPKKVENIGTYIKCLSIAHRRIQFRKQNNICDFDDCDEMVIS